MDWNSPPRTGAYGSPVVQRAAASAAVTVGWTNELSAASAAPRHSSSVANSRPRASISVRRALGTLGGRTDLLHLVGRHGVAAVAPAVAHVGEDVGELVVVQLTHRRHHGIEVIATHRDRAGKSIEHDADGPLLVRHEKVRVCERRKHIGQSLTVRLVANRAGARKTGF